MITPFGRWILHVRSDRVFLYLTRMIVYGIKNCNTVKTALDWLKKKKIDFEFHDYKSKGITDAKLKDWSKQVGWETLVNKRGTTWRQLDEAIQRKITSEKAAIALMKEKTSVIKRPLIEHNGKVVLLGFDVEEYGKKLV
jgi:arsenate reductase (glutaredoxin)